MGIRVQLACYVIGHEGEETWSLDDVGVQSWVGQGGCLYDEEFAREMCPMVKLRLDGHAFR